jgi:hypothetical protein
MIPIDVVVARRAARLHFPDPRPERAPSFAAPGFAPAVHEQLVARAPVSDFDRHPDAAERVRLTAEQRDIVVNMVGRYTRTTSCASASRSGTRGRSGSCLTAAR